MAATRHARVRALAKINLDLRVLGKRPDGFHELRTIFQTISLSDRLDLTYTPQRITEIVLKSTPDIPDNLAARAARQCLDEMSLTGRLEIALEKQIPIGAGLGGGSSDAAAVLLALPVLAGGVIPLDRLIAIGAGLGSDVPFFLLGGRAAGIGRGTELYPLPDVAAGSGLLVAPGIHVSTPEAYRGLSRGRLTLDALQNNINRFQRNVWRAGIAGGMNDFEETVFREHPSLGVLKARLLRLGANPAMMSGSGSSVFGFFSGREQVSRAIKSFRKEAAFPISLVSRARYRAFWRRWLAELRILSEWPPRSRYAR